MADNTFFSLIEGLPAGGASGPAGGDLSGTYPNPSVVALDGIPIADTPTTGEVLSYDGTNLVYSAAGGPPSGAAGGDLTGTYPNPTLGVSGVTAATYPSIGSIPQIAVDAKGRVTSASSVTDGSALTALNATNVTSGTLPTAQLPIVPESKGGLGSNISALGAGIITKTATNTYVSRSIASGTGTTVTNGAGTAGNMAVNVTYGTTSNTATQGNDTRLNPTPVTAGKVVYDTSTGYSSTTAGTSSQVLVGGSTPAFGNVPAAAIPTTTVTAASYPTSGHIPTFTVGTDGRLTAAGSSTSGSGSESKDCITSRESIDGSSMNDSMDGLESSKEGIFKFTLTSERSKFEKSIEDSTSALMA